MIKIMPFEWIAQTFSLMSVLNNFKCLVQNSLRIVNLSSCSQCIHTRESMLLIIQSRFRPSQGTTTEESSLRAIPNQIFAQIESPLLMVKVLFDNVSWVQSTSAGGTSCLIIPSWINAYEVISKLLQYLEKLP